MSGDKRIIGWDNRIEYSEKNKGWIKQKPISKKNIFFNENKKKLAWFCDDTFKKKK